MFSQFLRERFKIDMPHRFKVHNFLGPSFCDMCGQMMHGIFRQGVKCQGLCGIACAYMHIEHIQCVESVHADHVYTL